MASEDKKKPVTEQELRIKAQLYWIAGAFLLLTGMLISAVLFFKMAGGDTQSVIERPLLLLIFVLPFLPSYIFLMMADKSNKKAGKMREAANEGAE